MEFDYSVEYSHIYTNERINEEHEVSIRYLGDILHKLEVDNKTFSLAVLIDDYSFPDPTFDYKSFSSWLKSNGHEVDLVLRESQLIPVCDQVLHEIHENRIKKSLVEYVKGHKKYPCSLFIASWYLLRLGEISSPFFEKEKTASHLINILPESLKSFEDKAFDIISKSRFSGAELKITNYYHEGRVIA